ncbi:MAG TPA: PEP/pyruvate-binding domain-containing protein, partial [Myxococcota bacterium]|nr:PEP/pyruvate-binding domain-containing protein [Myxococcota bacterium]
TPLNDALRDALPSYGGAAAHLAALSAFGRPVPAPEGAVIPMAWYGRHMSAAGVFDRIDDLLTRPAFVSDPDARAQELRRIQDDIRAYPVDVDVSRSLRDALTGRYPHQLVRLTASTNAEDDGAVPSADLYDEIVVDLDGSPELLDDALRAMWAQLWSPRVYDQHSRLSIPPHDLGLAILARPERPARAAHGVIITHDGFGLTDREPTMYVNAQLGPGPLENGAPAVEQALVWGGWPASPITRLNDSALAGEGVAVLDRERMLDLADVIERIHQGFAPAYGEDGAWSMEVAFTLGAGGPEIEHVHPWSAP